MAKEIAKPNRSYQRRRKPLSPLYEAVATDITGQRIRGIAYRRSGTSTGDGYCYSFSMTELGGGSPEPSSGQNRQLLNALTSEDLNILILHFVVGWSLADIANELGYHRTTVYRRIRRALNKLRG